MVELGVPPLETERLRLRQIDLTDVDLRVAIRSDRVHCRFLLAPVDEDPRARIAWVLEDMARGGSKGWTFIKKSDGVAIGTAGIVRIDAKHHHASIAYEIVPAAAGYGYAREAVARLVRFAFEEMKLHRLQAEIHPDNAASRGLVEALGFVYEGTLRGNHFHEGQYYDDVIYGRLASDP